MHNGLVTMAGEKMSKSLGNTLQVREIVKQWRPVEVRYYLGAAHYRSTMEFSPEALDEAAAAYRRIENFVERAREVLGRGRRRRASCAPSSAAAMDDDLGVPPALGRAARPSSATATPRWPTGEHETLRGAFGAGHGDGARCSGLHPRQWHEQRAGELRPRSTRSCRSRSSSGPRPGRARTTPPPTRSATSWPRPGSRIEDTPDGPRWSLEGST